MDRKDLKGIGSSDISSILGINPFKTPLMLWSEKTGQVEPKDLSDNQAVEWGTRLERTVSKKFSDDHNVKLIAYKRRFVHPKYDFLSCELDNIIAGTDEIVEIKTVNAWAWKSWEKPDDLPSYVIAQVMFALGISGRKVAHVACLCGGQKYIEKRFEFDQEMFDDMVSKAVKFWQMVNDKEAPMTMSADNDTILDLYPESNDQIQQIEEFNVRIAHRQELKMHIDKMKDEVADIDAAIKQSIGDNLGLSTSKYVVKWNPQVRSSVDTDAMKTDGIYDAYTKQKKLRVLRITNRKEK